MLPKKITNFSAIADQYEAILLDLWGVVHDGSSMYPGARECLEQLHAKSIPVVMISNAPRRSEKAKAVLDALNIPPQYYKAVYTSGEVAYRYMQKDLFNLGRHFIFIGPERDADVLDGLGKQRVQTLGDAEFLLNVGYGSEQENSVNVSKMLSLAKDLELPMLCLNPDLHVVKISGERYECAGIIAQQYKDLGGKVHYFGKPYPQIYQMAHEELNLCDKSKILAIGDGLDTDIRGAVKFEVDAMLITGGILENNQDIEFATENTPTYVASHWQW